MRKKKEKKQRERIKRRARIFFKEQQQQPEQQQNTEETMIVIAMKTKQNHKQRTKVIKTNYCSPFSSLCENPRSENESRNARLSLHGW